MKKVLRILAILLILPQVLVAAQIPHYRMDSFALLSDEVFLCEEKKIEFVETEYHGGLKTVHCVIQCRVIESFKGEIKAGADMGLKYGASFARYRWGEHGHMDSFTSPPTRVEPKYVPAGKAVVFLKKLDDGEYQVVTAKLIQRAEILAFRQSDNPGPLVLFPQNPEQALVAEGTEPEAYDFIRDVRLSVAASRELKEPVRTDLIARRMRPGDGEDAGEWILAHLDRIVIPQVECEGASVEEVIDFARVRSIELDPESAKAPGGISFIICSPDDRKKDTDAVIKEGDDPGARRIDYVAKNVTLSRLLIEIGRRARLDVHVTDVGIILCTAGHPPFPNGKSQKGKIARTLYRVPKAVGRG